MTRKLGELSLAALEKQLEQGLRLRTGPVVTQIRTGLPQIAEALQRLYGEHALETEQTFADFHVQVAKPKGIRRFYKPQVLFFFDSEPPFHPLPADQAFPMLEWGMNWCISNHCHQFITIHAAVLERNGKALVLPAPPGSGKSTLCAGLAYNGWRLLSDELSLIDPTSLEITPLPRPISLKNQSIDVIRAFVPDAQMSTPVHDTIKGSVAHLRPPVEAVKRGSEKARPGWLVMPRFEAGSSAELVPITKAEALFEIMSNSFNHHLHGERAFNALADWISEAQTYRFTYSRLEEAVAIFAALAEGDVAQ